MPTIKELRAELFKRGAKATGRKAELIQRLEDYKRNFNFKPTSDPLPPADDCTTISWPSEGFRQLNTSAIPTLPEYTMKSMTSYFTERMALDARSSGDSQALKKGKLMEQSSRVTAASMLLKNRETFITAICRAAMKKAVGYITYYFAWFMLGVSFVKLYLSLSLFLFLSLSYNIKIQFNKYGELILTNCDCPAGAGSTATCKHIAATLIAILKIKQTGAMGSVNVGCTDTLQSFHKPTKSYDGTPIKIESLPVQSKSKSVYDPRPPATSAVDRNAKLYGLMVNYVHSSNHDVNLRYMYPRADLHTAQQDHDYLEEPFTHYWITESIKVSLEDIQRIEKDTVEQSRSRRWHEERRYRLTASRFGEIASITCRRNVEKFCHSLMSLDKISSPALSHGQMYESKAIETLEKELGRSVSQCGLFICYDHPCLAASPDGIIGNSLVEIKCPFTGRYEKVTPTNHFPFLTEQMELKRTHKYYDQVQGQLYITNKKHSYFVIYTFVDIKIINVPLDKEYCEDSLIPKLLSFYKRHYLPYLTTTL